MLSLVSLIVIITLSLLITRIATIALNHTGLSREVAAFQARSAFTGVGFTTSESEKIVNHPVRRKIFMGLMLIGNAGIISVMATLILTFVGSDEIVDWPLKLGILIVSIIILWVLSNSKIIDKWLSRVITKMLKCYTTLYVHDYASLFHFSEDYQLFEYYVDQNNWLTGKSLTETKLRSEGINLIGITRDDNTYIGTPRGDTRIESGDTLLLYGRKKSLKGLEKRKKGPKGDKSHQEAILRQQNHIKIQEDKDTADE